MERALGNIIWLVTCWGGALIFDGIALYSYKKKTPMHFWAGTTVKGEEVTDIAAYNKANAVMWLAYSAIMWIGGAAGIFNMLVGGVIIGASAFPGVLVLIFWYIKIERKYFRRYIEQ